MKSMLLPPSWRIFIPQLFLSLKNYSRQKFLKDLMAGIIVGIVALPLAIAFGIASGVSPEKGLITAIIGGFLVSALGGSTVQIGGPTGAFIVIVYGIIAEFGIEGLAVATLMAGILLVLMGFLRLGTVIRFIPYPIIVGFTSGIALTIFTTQIKDLLGLSIENLPGNFLGKWSAYISHLPTITWAAAAMGIATVAFVLLFPRISRRIPGSLVAIVLMTLAALALKRWGIEGLETIGDRFTFSSALPAFRPLSLDMATITRLFPSAFTIALLSAIESLLSASVADGVTGHKHNSHAELMAQGAANIVVPFFGGIPVTGAIARTMTNIRNGGQTPVAGLIHAFVLLLIMLFLGPLTAYIPMACLAGILVVVAINMSEFQSFVRIIRGSVEEAVVLVVTFVITVLVDLTVAIEVGMVLAVLLFMRRMYQTGAIKEHVGYIELGNEVESEEEDRLPLPAHVDVYEIQGPFFFGIANRFEEVTQHLDNAPKVRILRMRYVPFMDATGLHNLEMFVARCQQRGVTLILSGVNAEVRGLLERSGLADQIGKDRIKTNIHEAILLARELTA